MFSDALLDDVATWAEKTPRQLHGDIDEAEMLLTMLRDDVGVVDPGDLTPGALEELLLEVYPRKVTVLRHEDASAVIPTVRELVAFLGDTSRISDAKVEVLGRTVDGIEPKFLDAVMDRSNWGMARTFTQAMVESGVDLDDSDAVSRWIDRFNASLPKAPDTDYDAGSEDLKTTLDLPDRLPPIRLLPEDELVRYAQGSELLRRAEQLASWVGKRPRKLRNGELTAADAVAAARELGMEVGAGTEPSGTLPGMPPRPAVRRMDDIPDLVQLWELAAELDFIEIGDASTSARVGEGMTRWSTGTEDEVMDIWQHALAETLTRALPTAAALARHDDLELEGVGAAALIALFLARDEGVPLAEVREMIEELATAELPGDTTEAWEALVTRMGHPADYLVTTLADLGAVHVDADTVRLTPLASYATRLQMLDAGVDVPLLPPVEKMTAADIVAVATAGTTDELESESTAWLARRGPQAAVDELLAVAATGEPAKRMAAIGIATDVGADGEARWRQALAEPTLRPYAKIALAQLQGAEPGDVERDLEPTPADLAWLVTDTIAGLADSLEPDELMGQLDEVAPTGQAQQQLFEQIWRLDHPHAHDVLVTIGRHHTDKKVAKAARKAAYKVGPSAKRR